MSFRLSTGGFRNPPRQFARLLEFGNLLANLTPGSAQETGENAIHSITLSCNVSANKRGVSELWSHPGGEIRRLQDRFAIRPIVRYPYLIGALSQRRGTN